MFVFAKWNNRVQLTANLNIYLSTLLPSCIPTFSPIPLSSSIPSSVYFLLYFYSPCPISIVAFPIYHILSHSPVFPTLHFHLLFPILQTSFPCFYLHFFLPIYLSFSTSIFSRTLTSHFLTVHLPGLFHCFLPATHLPTYPPSLWLSPSVPPYPCSPRQS